MKKKIFGSLAIIMIATVAAFNLNLNTENKKMSLVTLANVEALANAESDDLGNPIKEWWDRLDYICEYKKCWDWYQKVEYYAHNSITVDPGKGTVAHSWECKDCF